jgi:hypothetical protein
VLGRRGCGVGPLGPARSRGEEKEKACWPGMVAGQNRRKGEREGEEKKRVFLFFSFKFSFQIHFSNIQTSIKQNLCIRIMMHKHLLFLN